MNTPTPASGIGKHIPHNQKKERKEEETKEEEEIFGKNFFDKTEYYLDRSNNIIKKAWPLGECLVFTSLTFLILVIGFTLFIKILIN